MGASEYSKRFCFAVNNVPKGWHGIRIQTSKRQCSYIDKKHVGAVDDGGAYRLHGVYFVLTRSIPLVQVIIGGEYGEWWDYRGWVEYCQGLPACAVVPKYITLYNITLHYIIARGY